jgi:large subunit ribosomal protein L5
MAEKKEPEVKAEAEVKETKTKKAAAPKAEKKAAKADDGKYVPNLKAKYQKEVAPALMQKFGYKSVMQIPKLDKIVVNCGCGEARENSKVLEAVVGDLTKITGQKAIITKAKKSVANFKLREEMPIGAKVTLRGDRMWEFLDRLFNVALPRVRDFRGINPNSFDGRGNYALGIKEQLIFPEIEYDKIDKIRGMDVVLCTTANTDEEARELLTLIGAPFADRA